MSVLWQGIKKTVCAVEVKLCDELINNSHVTAADVVCGQLFFFVRGSIRHYCEACVQEERTLGAAVAIMYSTFSLLKSPHHTNRKYPKWSTLK
jgi:hypothetical protein